MRSVILTKTLRRLSHLDIWRKRILGRKNSLCRDPGGGTSLVQGSARGRCGSGGVRMEWGRGRKPRDKVGRSIRQGPTFLREGAEVGQHVLAGRAAQFPSFLQEEDPLLTFSQLTHSCFWRGLHVFFLTSLFFYQSLNFCAVFSGKKKPSYFPPILFISEATGL